MKKGVIIALIILAVIAVIIVGVCALIGALNKERVSMTADQFNRIMESNGYVMTDTTNQFAEYGSLMTKSYVAQKSGYQIEFYELSNEENAISMYNTNKTRFESQKTNVSASSTVEMKNYAIYSLTTNGKYKYVSRINNTLVYLDVDTTYKDTVKDIIKEIGY